MAVPLGVADHKQQLDGRSVDGIGRIRLDLEDPVGGGGDLHAQHRVHAYGVE